MYLPPKWLDSRLDSTYITHVPCLLFVGAFIIQSDQYHSPKRDSNLGSSRIAVSEDCKANALNTQPPQLDLSFFLNQKRWILILLSLYHTGLILYFWFQSAMTKKSKITLKFYDLQKRSQVAHLKKVDLKRVSLCHLIRYPYTLF